MTMARLFIERRLWRKWDEVNAMRVAVQWLVFLGATFLTVYFYKYKFGPLDYGAKSLDATCIYAPSSVPVILGKMEKAGKLPLYYQTETTFDLVFPLVYGLMFVSAIASLIPGARARRLLVVLPVVAVIGDYAENTTIIAILKRFMPNPAADLGALPRIASIASGTKGIFLLFSTVAVLWLAIKWLVNRRS
jgi:hypothetical protein